ncbi:MAG: ankyrin repeat domain-containing protein [Pseudomonadota bacterium]
MAHPGRPRNHDPLADKIRQLIRHGSADEAIRVIRAASVSMSDGDAREPIHHAAFSGNVPVITWLLDNGADADSQDRHGHTALHFAVQEKHVDVIARLLDHGVDPTLVDSHGNAPLWRAVFDARGEYDIVKKLIAAGADPLAKNNSDRSPLDFAETIGDRDLIALLKANQ